MLLTFVRYGIVGIAAALAALSGSEASGCVGLFGGRCGSCCSTLRCGKHACGWKRSHCRWKSHRCGRACRKHRCCGPYAAMAGGYATFGMGCGIPAPAAAMPVFAMAVPPPHRPPVIVPPGTLGLTYRQISRLVPECEHPRTGMIEICDVPAGMVVAIEGMDGYQGRNGVWYFRSCRPLLPCTPTIHTAYISSPFGVPHVGPNYRAFRLIPGRIVSLRW